MIHEQKHKGFTIVELLIVIVVIAILAAITIVTYGGIKQRTDNTAVIDAASKTSRMIQSYIAANSADPAASGACVTVDSGCATGGVYSSNTTFNTNMATIGTAPRSVPIAGSDHYGIIYYYNASRVVNGVSRPIALLYWLQGTGQQCGLSGLLTDPNASSTTITSAAYTASNDSGSGKTLCALSIPS